MLTTVLALKNETGWSGREDSEKRHEVFDNKDKGKMKS